MDEIESIISRSENSKLIDTLNLSNRELKFLPNRISNLTHLKCLYLDNNRLIFIPEIGSLTQLEELSLENNEITLIPESCLNLKSLKTLNLSKNNLKCLAPNLLPNFVQLSVLWMNECGLMYLPKEIGCLVNLEKLGLKSNRLEDLPDEMGKLMNLKWLNLERNLLYESDRLDASLANLVTLNHLNLNNNKLECVPKFLFNLKKSLNVVLLKSNLIKVLKDEDVLGLSYLTRIDLRDNPCLKQIKAKNSSFYKELLMLKNFIIEIESNI